jgi:serine/threonine-protein kinase
MLKSLSDLVKSFGKDSNALLANRYEIINQVGRGAMGQVYKAIDKQSADITVAIKFLSQALIKEQMLKRFETEAKISALLGEQSNHIVKVKDYGLIDNKTPYYVMEYLEGNDLDSLIKKKTLSISQFLYLIRQICLGLECAHNGILVNGELATIIHRDIKPSNIFLAKNEQKHTICKILDFGIAQINEPERDASQRRFMGTPEYCSPEQMAEYELKPTSDIYSLGVLMYEMLTQKTPIKAENKTFQAWFRAHHEMIPKPFPTYIKLPKQLEKLIMRCLAKSPSDRPQSIKEILRIITPLERQYGYKKQQKTGSQSNISSVFKEQTISQPPPLQQIYKQNSWPDDKPQQKIVFPCLTEAKEGVFSSLWTMVEPQETRIFEPKLTFCFNHFLFQLNPHPMILWISLLYQRKHKPKWLPCYLDLKTEVGYQISNNLVSQGLYYILLFELTKKEKYRQILTMKISQEKINQLDKFILKSSSVSGTNKSRESKIALKQQFETIKNRILATIEKVKN